MDLVLPSPATLALFVSAALALLLIPGPAVFYLVGRSIEHGRRAGLMSVLGIQAATLVHVAAASLGLSALLASSALAFNLVKVAGAAYLIWLGLQKLFSRPAAASSGDTPLERPRLVRLMRDGFVVNLLNPKTAIFFLAFLPQFVDVSRGQVAAQIAVLGVILAALGLMTDSAYALAAGSVGSLLKHSRIYASVERYVTGVLLIGLGVTAAFAGNNRK